MILLLINKKKKEKFSDLDNYTLPKNIYCYWDDDLENVPLVKACYETWLRNIPKDWKINLVTNKNLDNYVSKEFIEKYKNLLMYDVIKFSDFLRLELLINNGGVWIDISTIIIKSDFLDKYRNEMLKNKYDVTVYELIENSNSRENPYLENWFIMAPKESKYIKDLQKEFIKSFDIGFLNYKKNILIPSGVNLNGTINYEDGIYLMQHAIVNYLIHTNHKYNINIKDSYESMFKFHNLLKWDNDKISYALANNKNWSPYYAVKLRNKDRRNIPDHLIINIVNNINLI